MRRVPTTAYPQGKVLARPVYTPSGEFLLPRGARLDDNVRRILARWGVGEVYVRETGADREGRTLTVPVESAVPEAVSEAYARAVSLAEEAAKAVRQGESGPLAALAVTGGALTLRIAREPDILGYLHLLSGEARYTQQHCIRVGILAALLAKWLGLAATDQEEIAQAGVVHDIGMALVPQEILDKPSALTEAELGVVKRHAHAGYELLAPLCGAQGTVARVALEHHERLDGSGYPRKLKGHQTVLAARVVAVADVFDAMTSNRVYKPSQPEYAVLAHLRESGFSLLDPRLIRVFVQHVVYRTLGRLVRLSNGQVGHVILVDSKHPAKPIVAVGDTLIDLRRTPGLELTGELRHA